MRVVDAVKALRDTSIPEDLTTCRWHTREFDSEDGAASFAATLDGSSILSVDEGPFITGPFPGVTGPTWLVEFCEWVPTN